MSSNSLNQRLALARATQHSDSQTTASGALPEASCCASFSNYGGHVSLTITHEGQSHGAFALHPDQVKSLLPYLLNEVNGEVGISPLDLAGLEVDAAGSEGINNLVSNDGLELHNRTPAEGDDERSAVGEDGGSSGLEPIEFDRRHSVEVEVGVGGDSGEVHNGLEDSSAQRQSALTGDSPLSDAPCCASSEIRKLRDARSKFDEQTATSPTGRPSKANIGEYLLVIAGTLEKLCLTYLQSPATEPDPKNLEFRGQPQLGTDEQPQR